MYMVVAETQTDPMESQEILKLLQEKSIELRQTAAKENEIQEVIDDTGKSSPNPKNELEYQKSCISKSSGLPLSLLSDSLTQSPLSETEKLKPFTHTLSNTPSNTPNKEDTNLCSEPLLPPSKILIGRSQSFKGSSSFPTKQYLDPYGRRASGGPISLSRPFANGHGKSGSYHGYSRSSTRSRSSDKFRTNGAENYINRHTSTTLSIPSRQASVQSCSSARSYSSEKGKINASLANSKDFYRFSRHNTTTSSMKSLKSLPIAGRASRSESIFSITGGIPLKDLPPKERRHKKVAISVFIVSSFLLIFAVLCIVISLLFSRHIDDKVRRENANILQSLQPTPSTINTSSTTSTNNNSPNKDPDSGGAGSGEGIRSTASPLTISNSDINYDSSNNPNNNNESSPPISQSLIVEAIVQGRQFYEKATPSPSSRINRFDLAMDLDREDDSGGSSL